MVEAKDEILITEGPGSAAEMLARSTEVINGFSTA